VLIREIILLFKKDLTIEWRNRYALNGLLLYLVSTLFVCYLSFYQASGSLNPITWNALFWIIMLFTSMNAVAKSFMQEPDGRQLYYYSIVSPQAIILSKIIYNTLLMLFLAIVGFFFYTIVMGNPVQNSTLFIVNLLLAAIAFSTTLTMISGIASKTENGHTLMAILSFPVILPVLLIVIKVSKNALDGLDPSVSLDEITTLIAVNMILGTVSYLLFPYLWKS